MPLSTNRDRHGLREGVAAVLFDARGSDARAMTDDDKTRQALESQLAVIRGSPGSCALKPRPVISVAAIPRKFTERP
jgi:hypothetical protein